MAAPRVQVGGNQVVKMIFNTRIGLQQADSCV